MQFNRHFDMIHVYADNLFTLQTNYSSKSIGICIYIKKKLITAYSFTLFRTNAVKIKYIFMCKLYYLPG